MESWGFLEPSEGPRQLPQRPARVCSQWGWSPVCALLGLQVLCCVGLVLEGSSWPVWVPPPYFSRVLLQPEF